MAIKDEISNDPMGLGYATWLPDSPGTVCDLLNAKNYSLPQSMFVREIEIIGLHPDGPIAGDEVLAKLEAFSLTSHPLARIVVRALNALRQTEGLDLGTDAVQSMLTLLVPDALTVAESDALKFIASQPASRAEVLGVGVVTIEQVIGAL